MIFAGIDNGLTGAVVAVDFSRHLVLARVMPTLPRGKTGRMLDLHRWHGILAELAAKPGGCVCVLEHAQATPQMGRSSAFNYGLGYGATLGILAGLGISYEVVRPRRWQGMVLKGLPGSDTKARAILKAQRVLPELDLVPGAKTKRRKPHTGLADAACMSLYAWETARIAAVEEGAAPRPDADGAQLSLIGGKG